ncbi:MAG: LamG domain-containing protein, partial [Lentisphaeria bacterium]|nr:LamG domain-containing protein [Lentisphaeria bacterium]
LFVPDIALRPAILELDKKLLDPHHFSICAWIYPRTDRNGYRYIASVAGPTPSGHLKEFKFSLYDMVPELASCEKNNWNGILRYYDGLRAGKNGQEIIPLLRCPKAEPGQWNFMAATFDNGIFKVFLNGVQVGKTVISNRKELVWSASLPIRIGFGFDGSGFDGLIDRLAIFNCSLTPEEIEFRRQQQLKFYENRKFSIVSRREELHKDHDRYFKKTLPQTAEYLKTLPGKKTFSAPSDYAIASAHGANMIQRNGKTESSSGIMPHGPVSYADDVVADFAAAGLRYVQVGISSQEAWLENSSCQGAIRYIANTVRFVPDARIIVRIMLRPPPWWLKKHAEEFDRTEDGKTSGQPSLSSKIWVQDACIALTRLIQKIENNPEIGGRIAGYLLAGGRAAEWYWFASNKGWIDYNPKNIACFRDWLRKYYNNDEAALRRSWHDDKVTFDNAMIPPGKLRRVSEHGFFRDMKKSRQVADHLRYMADIVSGDIATLAKAARKASKTRKLIGIFNGYSTWHGDLSNQGFLCFDKILENPELDFISSPLCYINRCAGFAGDDMNGYLASMRLHGKLFWCEADMRSCFSDETNVPYFTSTLEETRSVHWRTWGNCMTQGTGLWWVLLTGNQTFHNELLMKDIAAMSSEEPELFKRNRQSVAKIAVLCDEESMLYVNAFQPLFHAWNREARERLAHIGAPMDFYLQSDITNPNMPDYPVYVFLNSYYVTPEKREIIRKKISRNHAITVWCHAPGYLSEIGRSRETMKLLTGFSFAERGNNVRCTLQLTGKHPFTQDMVSGKEEFNPNPIFYVRPDAETTVLGTLKDFPVLAVRENECGTQVFSMLPPSADLMRGICRAAGIHLYCEQGDVVRANANLVMIHASSSGVKKINLPWSGEVREIITKKVFPSGKITLPMKFGETALFMPVQAQK